MNDVWQLSVQREIWGDEVAFRLGVKRDGVLSVMTPAVMQSIPLGQIVQPAFRLPFDVAQRLMDELWQAGCRPTQAIGSAGQIESVKYHLEDMRRLVFERKE